MGPDLRGAARAGNINDLYAIIQSKPDILDKKLFVETPLHVAASPGETHFALEILRLKPSFGKKLNPEGLSPLHLALQNKHSEIVRLLVKFNSKLICVKEREGLTVSPLPIPLPKWRTHSSTPPTPLASGRSRWWPIKASLNCV
ncbi:hypothetical protein ACSBR1_043834 [Camellia fascicularis]